MGTQKRNSVYIYYHNKKKEYFYLSTFTIKPKKKTSIIQNAIIYQKHILYIYIYSHIYIEENSLISQKKKKIKKKKKRTPRGDNSCLRVRVVSSHEYQTI